MQAPMSIWEEGERERTGGAFEVWVEAEETCRGCVRIVII
jgi:hypothetical protein